MDIKQNSILLRSELRYYHTLLCAIRLKNVYCTLFEKDTELIKYIYLKKH